MEICNPKETIEEQFTTFSSQDFTLILRVFSIPNKHGNFYWSTFGLPLPQVLGHLPCLATGSINTTASTTALRFSGYATAVFFQKSKWRIPVPLVPLQKNTKEYKRYHPRILFVSPQQNILEFEISWIQCCTDNSYPLMAGLLLEHGRMPEHILELLSLKGVMVIISCHSSPFDPPSNVAMLLAEWSIESASPWGAPNGIYEVSKSQKSNAEMLPQVEG